VFSSLHPFWGSLEHALGQGESKVTVVKSVMIPFVKDKSKYDTPKLPAWYNKVSEYVAYTYTPRLHKPIIDLRENVVVDYQHYPTTNTNTTLVSY
jgi:hypothetical protein